ncbi:hypothetical protein MHYP_G00184920 [Metynnis hypsauchen]
MRPGEEVSSTRAPAETRVSDKLRQRSVWTEAYASSLASRLCDSWLRRMDPQCWRFDNSPRFPLSAGPCDGPPSPRNHPALEINRAVPESSDCREPGLGRGWVPRL